MSSVLIACNARGEGPNGFSFNDKRIRLRFGVLDIAGCKRLLAAAVPPLVITTLVFALREKFDRHRRIARWTYPIWLYVSVTGVLVYLMLYKVYGGHA